MLPSSLIVIGSSFLGGEGTAACLVGRGRNKRKGRSSRSAAQANTDAGSSGASGGINSIHRDCGKRARRAVGDDEDVVILEAEDRPAVVGKKTEGGNRITSRDEAGTLVAALTGGVQQVRRTELICAKGCRHVTQQLVQGNALALLCARQT